MVHLIINATQASDLLLKAQTGLEKNSPVFKHWSKFINFWDIVIIDFHSFLFKIKKIMFLSRKLVLPDISIA